LALSACGLLVKNFREMKTSIFIECIAHNYKGPRGPLNPPSNSPTIQQHYLFGLLLGSALNIQFCILQQMRALPYLGGVQK